MNVATIEVEAEVAKAKYKEYLEASKKQASKEYSAARRAYRALSKGYKIIDVYKAFEKTGKKKNDTPKLALVRADAKTVYFTKLPKGGGEFRRTQPRNWGNQPAPDLMLPENTFKDWQRTEPTPQSTWTTIEERELETNVPFIPPHIAPKGALDKYYILFEVDEWKATAAVVDPYLLQRLNDNTFIVLAEWDVSPVEAMIMRGAP